MLRTWSLERRHEQDSPYYYAELPRGGRGSETNYTGQSLHDWISVCSGGITYRNMTLPSESERCTANPTVTQHIALWLRDAQQSSRSTMR